MSVYWQYDARMSTLQEMWPEPDSEAIRVRLRAYMGINKVSRTKLALASGITRSSLANKLDGPVEFTVSEIMAIAHALGRSWMWVMTGEQTKPPTDPSRLGESNPRPIHYLHRDSAPITALSGRWNPSRPRPLQRVS